MLEYSHMSFHSLKGSVRDMIMSTGAALCVRISIRTQLRSSPLAWHEEEQACGAAPSCDGVGSCVEKLRSECKERMLRCVLHTRRYIHGQCEVLAQTHTCLLGRLLHTAYVKQAHQHPAD